MKLSPESLDHMMQAMRPLSDKVKDHAKRLQDDPRIEGQNVAMRLRWDWCRAAGLTPFLCDIYKRENVNDCHIDTALRHAVKELGFPEFSV